VGLDLDVEVTARRAGDPPRLVGSVDLARAELGWTASRDLDAMTTSAWSAWQANPPAS
jgi:UDP-glucose 4-epimerase